MSKFANDIKLNNDLLRCLDGEASKSELEWLNQWLDADSSHKAYYNKVKALWNNELHADDKARFDANVAWSNFEKENTITILKSVKPTKNLKTVAFNALKIAAVILIALIIKQANLFKNETINYSSDESKQELVLPDNSVIYLNKNTEITYKKKFSRNKREVNFSGEAFFDIAHNPDKPFIIYTNNVKIEVLGTSFNVKANKGEPIEVVVKTGVVAVSHMNDAQETSVVKLLKDDRIEIGAEEVTPQIIVEVNNDLNYLAWKDDVYSFDSVPMQQVIETLQHGFDTTIVIRNAAFNDCMLMANFDKLSLDQIFRILQRTYDISYQYSNDTIYVDGKGCD